jgi:hypothetical protein
MNRESIDSAAEALLGVLGLGRGLSKEAARAGLSRLAQHNDDATLRSELVRALTGCTEPEVLDALAVRMREDPDRAVRRACAQAILHDPRTERRELAARALEVVPDAESPAPLRLIERLREARSSFLALAPELGQSVLRTFVATGEAAVATLRRVHARLRRELSESDDPNSDLVLEATFGSSRSRRRAPKADEFDLRVPIFPDRLVYPRKPEPGEADKPTDRADYLSVRVRGAAIESASRAAGSEAEFVATLEIEAAQRPRVAGGFLVCALCGVDVALARLPVQGDPSEPLRVPLRGVLALGQLESRLAIDPSRMRLEIFVRPAEKLD